ncbi:MAG: response regulator [Candidatus Neomarinimicrobiota bacterium]
MKTAKHILIIDDDVQLVDSVQTLLESVGYSVSFAYQQEAGIRLAKELKPDLILLDVMFAGPPGPDGFEVSRIFHQNIELKEIPIIMLSGVRRALDLPFLLSPDETWMPVRAFLEKPVKPEVLLNKIKEVLA